MQAATNGPIVFEQMLRELSSFLLLPTVVNFGAVSRHFAALLDSSRSPRGQSFWKCWAVRFGGIKPYKGPTIDFKFKLMQAKLQHLTKAAKKLKVPRRSRAWWALCDVCGKICWPTYFDPHCFDDPAHSFCNCATTACDSDLQIARRWVQTKLCREAQRRERIRAELARIDAREAALLGQVQAIHSVRRVSVMRPALEQICQDGRTKSVRGQAASALRALEALTATTQRVRPNPNCSDVHGAPIG